MIDRLLRPDRGGGVAPRRFRDRVLVAMLTVALVPLGIFALVVAADLASVTRSTVDETNRSILRDQVDAHQREVGNQAQALRVRVDEVAATLRALRDLAGQAPGPPAGGALRTEFVEHRGVHYVSDGASTVLAGRPLGAAGFDPAVAARDADATRALLGKMLDLVRTVPGVIQDVWVADTVDTVVRTVPGIPGVRAALDRRAIDGEALLGIDGGTPFSAIAAGAGAARAEPSAWAGDPARPDAARSTDPSVHWTETYATGTASDPSADAGATAWMAAGMGGRLRVGIDVSAGQLSAGLLDLHPSGEPHAYPLLLSSGNRLLAGGNPGTHEFGDVGGPLRLPADPAFRDGLAAVEATGHPQALPVRVGGEDKVLFTAPIPGVEWVLATVVPRTDLLPEQAGLARGIETGVRRILFHVVPVALLLCGLAFGLAHLLARRLVDPVRALTVAAERLGDGHTDEPVPPQGADEVGQLAISLERMRRDINASRDAIMAAARELEGRVTERTAQLRDRNEELVALNALAASLTRSLDPVAILGDALDTMRALLPLSAGRGWLHQGGRLSAAAVWGAPAPGLDAELRAVAQRASEEHRLVVRRVAGGRLVGLPLETGDGPLGALALATGRPELEARTRTLLRGVGDLVGLALRTARLSAEGRELAVLEERTRLAREIHDTLAQQLTAIVLQLEAAEVFLERDEARARQVVVSAREQARSALAEARRSVWDLRPAPLDQTGLGAALRHEARHWQARSGIGARVRTQGLPVPLALDPQTEVALFRIAQEALANVALHSHAGRVDIRLELRSGVLRLSIRDDGDGFEAGERSPGCFGLVGMAERARLAGATLEIESSPGSGTRVTVRLPLGDVAVSASA
ncbi:MAG TPA: histidine kinase [Candidatus Dormibacteraeota bacterium]|nr:histidine kinase [Candidatus Dormibacteraeota bacterium]